MAMTLGQQSARLQELIAPITPAEAKRRILNAYLHNSEVHPWQHLIARFTLTTEAQYNTGTIDMVANTNTATLTGGTWVPSWATAPSMRRMSVTLRKEPNDVVIFPDAATVTLADNFIGPLDIVDGSYALYRDVYPLPGDCGYAKLMALYDPQQRSGDMGRLRFFTQQRLITERSYNPSLIGIPQCFTLFSQTSETPPRPQILLFPAPTDVYVYHGWYFRRPAVLTTDAQNFDWPAEYDDMHWLKGLIDYYEQPRTFSQRMLALYKPKYAEMFRKMKMDLDGNNAIENEVQGTRDNPHRSFPMFYGSTGTGSISWG